MSRRQLQAVAIGVPARDEADRVVGCLESVLAAVAALGVPASVVVAADRCADDTAALAAAALAAAGPTVATAVVRGDDGLVGVARQAACARAVGLLERPLERIWLATTDADTVVPVTWLQDQWRWAETGADGVAGLVAVDSWEGHSPAVRARFTTALARAGMGLGHPHVHGANLGLRASLWEQCGGFPPVARAEDHHLWRAARLQGAVLIGADDVVVDTSGRLDGRAPGGFAQFLTELTELSDSA